MAEKSVYVKHGYKNRDHYLMSLADDFCVDPQVVYSLAEVLGPDEDFDGLVVSLEDASSCL